MMKIRPLLFDGMPATHPQLFFYTDSASPLSRGERARRCTQFIEVVRASRAASVTYDILFPDPM